jgi:hypothetical protein
MLELVSCECNLRFTAAGTHPPKWGGRHLRPRIVQGGADRGRRRFWVGELDAVLKPTRLATAASPISQRACAAEAVKANPEKSDRAIAADIGVAPNTVKAARDELRNTAQLEDTPRTASTARPLATAPGNSVGAFGPN